MRRLVRTKRGFVLGRFAQNLLLQAQQVALAGRRRRRFECVQLGGQRRGQTRVVGCHLDLAGAGVKLVEQRTRRRERRGVAVKTLLEHRESVAERFALA